MLIFNRNIESKIKELLFKGKAIFLFGPRQAGKTTLSKKLIAEYGDAGAYFNCESMEVRKAFVLGDPEPLKDLIGKKKIVVFDEAQTIQNIGAILKLFVDTYTKVQIIATGSSSFDLANKINEPMTGRTFEFTLYPLSLSEIKASKKVMESDLLEYMRTGMYPNIVAEKTSLLKESILKNITTNYLYKDVYIYESIRNPQIFEDIIKMLALQIGQMVSVNEIAKSVGVSRDTVNKYLRLLEQAYIVKKVRSYAKNDRNELKKSFKVYFLDLGVRNAVIDNLDEVSGRADKGALFENFYFLEKLKEFSLETFPTRIFFWRTNQKLEIDFLFTKGTKIEAVECKWSDKDVKFTKFKSVYPEATASVVTLKDLI